MQNAEFSTKSTIVIIMPKTAEKYLKTAKCVKTYENGRYLQKMPNFRLAKIFIYIIKNRIL